MGKIITKKRLHSDLHDSKNEDQILPHCLFKQRDDMVL